MAALEEGPPSDSMASAGVHSIGFGASKDEGSDGKQVKRRKQQKRMEEEPVKPLTEDARGVFGFKTVDGKTETKPLTDFDGDVRPFLQDRKGCGPHCRPAMCC